MRKTITAIAAAAALGTATMATSAMAFPHGGGMGAPPLHANFGAAASGNFAAGKTGSNFATKPNGITAMPNHFAANSNLGQNNFWHGHGHHAYRHHERGFGGLYAYGGPDYYDYYSYYGNSCYQWQRVWTPSGWRWRDVWVCD